MPDKKTPKLDELEHGPWPSFVTEIKKAAIRNESAKDLLNLLERSYDDKRGHWKHGGIVGVRGYGGGVIGRYTDLPEEYPHVAEFHTMRINAPSAWFYKTETLRTLCDIWEKHGSGLTNVHGSTGDLIFLGMKTEELQKTYDELSDAGFDLGGSGSCLRSPSCCVGPARCESACYDTLALCYDLTNSYQDELHRPMWPYKFKFKMSGCANDCVAAIARADCSIIGTWRDSIQVDQDQVKAYAESGLDIQGMVCDKCPTRALKYDHEKKELHVIAEDCSRCMHCINVMPKAVRPGKEKGATILLGGKSTIVQSAFLSWVIVPFMKMEPPYTEFKEMVARIWDWWDENGKTRERLGELIYRLGMTKFLREVGLPPVPQMVFRPRANPYVFWPQDEIVK
ncbi:sulfite reductase (NADPH) [Acididesulfobacillus acetoxydans]|uniref:Sulfite reductase (NADPH) n=1 Tax=Acididesulfobacillus acetoxydans TaxID=1561005 RepID=A0A8S0W6P1_9FIRM|nr:dissimilatory-type sulfite reductase subunit alpha [Acididesulfobacillus acetoxydans]CAA7600019.1 sulfite reductase (NADPH) [Acididesulfobacillus acetoxydans]CEJ07794.1 Sulfite reductase, dissimilatory-type subunit alpha [Acididesulfobacillus acetoxydans]